ncbi:hypothetical protein F4820DRAFT_311046 [Hypoxylon rubiginosum]|uniref:Uncharacterized protein n=1 Tax=Hypoxylon rubiginosum TaxID=110542 RepID=A0ACB9Z0Q2_9PEZI|nr:hypothetical protein F4820DRAFT_311046 [Hypoxylon rubiginosum]
MKFHSFLFSPILLAGLGLAWNVASPRGITTISIGAAPPPPSPTVEPPAPGTASAPPGTDSAPPGTASAPVPSGSGGVGPKCGKGYTYCGYMLTSNGHNFAPNDISKAYCSGLSELCANGKPKTDVQEAVFVCMNEQPSNVELLCACSGKCRNDAESNFIAHCDKPCING